jgi:LemA protein
MGVAAIVFLGIVVVLAVYGVVMYNRLVALKNRYRNAFAQIEVQLKRRYDLIPNLVSTAKRYLKHEAETLEKVTQARNQALAGLQQAAADPSDPGAIRALSGAEGALAGALGRLNVVMEAYPELKADGTMQQLSEEITSTENRVAFSRQAFNDQVMDYNTYRQSFPQNVMAPVFGHARDAELLEFADSAEIQAAPQVVFD